MGAGYWLEAALSIVAGYLSGSVSYAIIISRLVSGAEIRDQGTRNPGTMNVLRTVGKGWGVLVGFLDPLKAALPMYAARRMFFSGDSALDYLIVVTVGIAAIMGHRKPIFHGFKGGGSVGCAMGVYLYILPVEFLISFVISGLIAVLFMKNVPLRFGRWVPIIAIVIAPFISIPIGLLIDISLFAGVSMGGHPWFVIAGAFAVSLTMLGLNVGFLLGQAKGG